MLSYRCCIAYIILLASSLHGYAQELPPITNYRPQVYNGGNQNWSISQSTDKYIYVANNEGLLEFNGSTWELYPSPNRTILRSVHVTDGTIYTGSYMDFGYWKRDDFGRLQYTSLGEPIYSEMVEDEQFWKIKNSGQWILFQSLNRIYIYDTIKGGTKYINTSGIVTMFETGDGIYFQEVNSGVFKISNGISEKVDALDSLRENRIINVFEDKDALLILTETEGFFRLSQGKLTKWRTELDTILEGENIYSAIKLKDESYAIGTISKGLLHVGFSGNVLLELNQANGLNNNTVLSLFEDFNENVWVGLDNGITLINLKSRLSIFNDDEGKIGAVYDTQEFQGKLFLGTNQGLFYKKLDSDDSFTFVTGTSGQVWDLFIHDNSLFCGHNSGTFLVENESAKMISDIPGTWNIQIIPNSKSLLQGNYAGISVLEKNGGDWRLGYSISGFDYSSRYLEIDSNNDLWVNHEYKGVFKLKMNENFDAITEVALDSTIDKGKSSGLIKYNDKILYAFSKGVFEFDPINNGFKKDSLLSASISGDNNYVSGRMIVDRDNSLWMFSESNINLISEGQFSEQVIVNTVSIPSKLRNSIIGYENISLLDDGRYILGTTSGYLLLDTSVERQVNNSIYLNSITTLGSNGSAERITLGKEETKFSPNQNSLKFNYTTPNYDKYHTTSYQYFLEGYNEYWSDWDENGAMTFENLPHGSYNFKARSRTGDLLSENVIDVHFVIERPWFLSNLAVMSYFIFGILFFAGINWFYKRYYRRQREALLEKSNREMELKELEAQKEIIQLRNNHLNLDIEARNRELAISTMNMIKKNETLNDIKDELSKLENVEAIDPVMRIINKNINNKEDWKFFEEAFNHADKDFFKKVKELHPQLTSNDLRLCVYLRMNLSSKEIAPLLNISPRSVEIKRYRLRKKINLEREVNLNEYFIGL